jgi:hypothetical protein
MIQLVNLLNNDRPNKEEDDIADLPWLTDMDHVEIQREFLFLRQRADTSKPMWFRTGVLTRYKNHGYYEVDETIPFSCVLIFLDYDKKQIATSALFEIHNGNIIMIRARAFLGVPPKERNHWQKYQIRNDLHLNR